MQKEPGWENQASSDGDGGGAFLELQASAQMKDLDEVEQGQEQVMVTQEKAGNVACGVTMMEKMMVLLIMYFLYHGPDEWF